MSDDPPGLNGVLSVCGSDTEHGAPAKGHEVRGFFRLCHQLHQVGFGDARQSGFLRVLGEGVQAVAEKKASRLHVTGNDTRVLKRGAHAGHLSLVAAGKAREFTDTDASPIPDVGLPEDGENLDVSDEAGGVCHEFRVSG